MRLVNTGVGSYRANVDTQLYGFNGVSFSHDTVESL